MHEAPMNLNLVKRKYQPNYLISPNSTQTFSMLDASVGNHRVGLAQLRYYYTSLSIKPMYIGNVSRRPDLPTL